jgi:hypothetical protein
MSEMLELLSGFGIVYDEDGVSHAFMNPIAMAPLCGKEVLKSAAYKTGVCQECRTLLREMRVISEEDETDLDLSGFASQEDRKLLLELLVKYEMIQMTMIPDPDGTAFNYNFKFRIPR